jgi:hypothetical protein
VADRHCIDFDTYFLGQWVAQIDVFDHEWLAEFSENGCPYSSHAFDTSIRLTTSW